MGIKIIYNMNLIKFITNPRVFLQNKAAIIADSKIKQQNFIPITETRDEDIFIAGYPKSGNTWMQNLVAGLLFGIDPVFLPDHLTQELVPDVHGKRYYKRFLDFTCFKTHHLPQPEYKRVIHLVRDGRDAMVSYYHMHKAMGKNTSLEDMVIDGKGIFPSKWHQHCQEWSENPYQSDLIVVRYEDLIRQPLIEMQKLCEFMNIERTPDLIKKIVDGNTFQKMKSKEKKFGWNNNQWNFENDFIRKGKIGSYKEEMPKKLISFFNQEAKEALNLFSYAN